VKVTIKYGFPTLKPGQSLAFKPNQKLCFWQSETLDELGLVVRAENWSSAWEPTYEKIPGLTQQLFTYEVRKLLELTLYVLFILLLPNQLDFQALNPLIVFIAVNSVSSGSNFGGGDGGGGSATQFLAFVELLDEYQGQGQPPLAISEAPSTDQILSFGCFVKQSDGSWLWHCSPEAFPQVANEKHQGLYLMPPGLEKTWAAKLKK